MQDRRDAIASGTEYTQCAYKILSRIAGTTMRDNAAVVATGERRARPKRFIAQGEARDDAATATLQSKVNARHSANDAEKVWKIYAKTFV